MRRSVLTLILLWAGSFARAQPRAVERHPAHQNTQDVFRGLTVASFGGTSQDSIQSLATDSSGNIYLAGTTFSANFPVKNAAQPAFGDSAILRTTDLGATWTRLASPPGVVDVVAADPVAPQIIFATGPNGIFKSVDSGQTWHAVYSISTQPSTAPIRVAIDPGNHLHVAALILPTTLLRSFDGGNSWTPGPVGCGLSDCVGVMLADPTGSGSLMVVDSYDSASISRDWGATFTPLEPPAAAGEIITAAFDPSHPGWLYLAGLGNGTGTLFLTTDYGATWTAKAAPGPSYALISSIAVNPNQPSILIATLGSGFYKSSDSAASWTYQTPAPAGQYVPASGPVSFVIAPQACSAAGGVLEESGAASFSPDYGVTWTTPQLSGVTSIASGPGCAFYVTRNVSSDVFVAKLAAEGGVEWATYLGGSDQDAPIALKVDPQGDAFVAGNTSSPDFPTTVAHIGVAGENSTFVAKYSGNGALLYSATIGGETTNIANGLAIDPEDDAYLIVTSQSKHFPVTITTLATSGPGFLVKLSPDAALTYATNLGEAIPGAILVDSNEEPIVASYGAIVPNSSTTEAEFVMKLDRGATQVLNTTTLPVNLARSGQGVTGMALDSQNNLVVLGQAGLGTFPASWKMFSPDSQFCNYGAHSFPSPTAFVTTLNAANWQPISGAVISTCQMQTGNVSIDPSGALVLSVASGLGLPMHGAVVGGPVCTTNSGGIVKLSADASTVQFGSYLDTCGPPPVAFASDGSIYAGVGPPMVLHLQAAPEMSLDQISNAFSGNSSAVAPGGLYTLALSNFQPASTNLGFTPRGGLPDQVNGVEVKFDGVAAPIFATSFGQVTVAAPEEFTDKRDGQLTEVQVFYNGTSSNPVWMPISTSLPGLMMIDPGTQDGNIRNQDGTLNSAANPATAGSTITLFVTGVGSTSPAVASGSIATSAVAPVTPLYSTWSMYPTPFLPITSIPGFISALFQVSVVVPQFVVSAQGPTRATIQLVYELPAASLAFPASNTIGVYVK